MLWFMVNDTGSEVVCCCSGTVSQRSDSFAGFKGCQHFWLTGYSVLGFGIAGCPIDATHVKLPTYGVYFIILVNLSQDPISTYNACHL